MPAGTTFTFTPLPSEVAPNPASTQPTSDIENDYNRPLRALKELIAAINGGSAGTDVNGNALQNYTGIGILDRLTAIEDTGRIQDSTMIQIGTTLGAGDRAIRMNLGSLTAYAELFYNNTDSTLKFRNQAGTALRIKAAAPTASDDLTTKAYVDALTGGGIFAKACWCAPPVRTAARTFSIDSIYSQNHNGTRSLVKSTATTINLNNTGINGLAASSASKLIAGTISVSSGSATITGVGTTFTADFIPGDYFVTNGGQVRQILTVTNNTTMTSTVNFSTNESSVAYQRGGALPSTAWDLNLYAVSDGVTTGFMLSSRNTLGGDTLVDLPKVAKTGTATFTNASPTVTGSGTLFLSEFQVGQEISVVSGGSMTWGTILSIESDTSLTLTSNATATVTSGAVYVDYLYYRQLPFACPFDGSANLYNFQVTGFPWNTLITLMGNSSEYALVTNNVSASNQSSNPITNYRAPDLTTRMKVAVFAQSVVNGTAPAFFSIGSASGDAAMSVGPFAYYNGTQYFGTASQQGEVDLDANSLFWYFSGTTNVRGDVSMLGAYLGAWR
jgi:preprotein translocase subunit YajC